MKKRIKYEPKLVSIEDVVEKFKSEQDLISALRDGELVAYGYHLEHATMEPSAEAVSIPSSYWKSYTFNNRTLSREYDTENQICYDIYTDIEVDTRNLPTLLNGTIDGRGAAPKYDWEAFYLAVAYYLFRAVDGEAEENDYYMPSSLQEWAKTCEDDFKYVWGGTAGPSITSLEEKLRPLFLAIQEKTEQPIQAHIDKKRMGGS